MNPSYKISVLLVIFLPLQVMFFFLFFPLSALTMDTATSGHEKDTKESTRERSKRRSSLGAHVPVQANANWVML